MKERVTTIEVRQKLGDLLNRVDLRHDQFIIERKGKPIAALVPVEKLDQMDRAARLQILEILERQKGLASLSQTEADQLADRAFEVILSRSILVELRRCLDYPKLRKFIPLADDEIDRWILGRGSKRALRG